MKILHITDLHRRRHWFDWAQRAARDVDVVAFSGDWLDLLANDRTSLRRQVAWVSAWAAALPCPLVTCTGNHDVLQADEGLNAGDEDGGWLIKLRRPGRVMVDGDDTVIAGIRLISRPWLGGVSPIPGDEPTVLVCHEGPAESGVVGEDLGANGDPEVAAIAAALPGGSWVLSGHIHEPPNWHDQVGRAHCSNPGVAPWKAPIPNHVVLDTNRRTAAFHRWNGAVEEVRY